MFDKVAVVVVVARARAWAAVAVVLVACRLDIAWCFSADTAAVESMAATLTWDDWMSWMSLRGRCSREPSLDASGGGMAAAAWRRQ